MSDTAARIALRARIVIPVSSPPLDGGIVTLQGDRIVAVGQNTSPAPPRDLGDVALLPGLVNPHTHLEFSELTTPLGDPGMRLPEWIEQVVVLRRNNAARDAAILSTQRRPQALHTGIRQCLQGGTTTVADIATWDVTEEMLPAVAPQYNALRELIGLTAGKVEEQMAVAGRFLDLPLSQPTRIVRGLSPHAPYTVAPELVRHAVQLSREHQLTLAIHLAESSEELQLLARGDGPFRELLQRFDIWDEHAFPGGRSPLDYLKMLGESHRSLVVHGNYLRPDDWTWLSAHRSTMSVVYCPRTHNYFRHPPYPLGSMLRAGVRVVLGTDGRASNPDLNSLAELQFAAQRHSDVAPRDLLRMVTLDAAASLGCAQQRGSLECGKVADLAIVRLHETPARGADPYAALLSPVARVCGTWVGGIQWYAG